MRTQIALVSLSWGALALGGCQFDVAGTTPPKPDLVKITPNSGYNGEEVTVVIEGHNLKPLITQDVSQPGGLVIDTDFSARLGDNELAQVVYVDDQHLNALVPQGIAAGVYPLTVVTPAGDEATLANAYTATATRQPVLTAVAPTDVVNDLAEIVTVSGQYFAPGMTATLEASGLATVPLALSNLSPTSVEALVPVGAAPGSYALSALSADNQTSRLENAVTIWAPAALVASVTVSHTRANLGQAFTVTVSVANNGGSTSQGVAVGVPTQNGSGAATLDGTAPAAVDIAAGESHDYVFSYTAATAGDVTFTVAANGSNEFSGRANNAAAVTSPTLAIEPGAALTVQVSVTPVLTPIDTAIQLTVDVTNSGGARALQVAPVITQVAPLAELATGPTPAQVDLSGTASHSFVYDYRAATAGTFHFEVAVAGIDQNNQQTVSATVVHSADVTIQSMNAMLRAVITVPVSVSVGQAFPVQVDVSNLGLSSALAVSTALTHAPAGLISETVAASPLSIDISSTGQHRYDFTFSAVSAGDVVVSGVAHGIDDFAGNPTASPQASSTVIHVQTAAALAASWTVPGTISAGQAFDAVLTVANSGQAAAIGVAPTDVVPANATCQPAAPATADIAGGGNAVFTFACLAGASGSASISAGAAGSDANSTQPAIATSASSSTITVQSVPALVASWSLPAAVTINQSFTVTLTVTNTGEAAANNVAPTDFVATGAITCQGTAPAPASATVGGGASQDFVYQCTASATDGSATVAAGAAGVDANSGDPTVATTATSTSLPVQLPPALVASWIIPAAVNVDQNFTVTLRIVNSGGARASNIVPTTLVLTPASGGATCTEPPTPATGSADGNNGEAIFVYSCQAVGAAGTSVTVAAGAAGVDANTGTAVTAASDTSNPITIQTPGQLSLAWSSVPTTVSTGQVVAGITLTVTNNGGTAVQNVAPSAAVATPVSGGASATCTGPVPASTARINGSASASFTYSCTFGSSAGGVTLSASATGTDINTGNPVIASDQASGTIVVQTAAALSAAWSTPPATVSRGQVFDVTLTVTNAGEAAANAVAPNGFTVTGTTATACVLQAPATFTILGNDDSHGFVYRCTAGSASGSATLSSAARGTDANSGSQVNSNTAVSASFTVQSAPAFTLAWTVPAAVNRNQVFTATLRITNTGQATANTVAPGTITYGGTSGAGTVCTGPVPASVATLTGGNFADFVYSCTASNTRGTLTLTAGATGTDANTTGTVTAAPVTSANIAVQNPAALAVDSVSTTPTQVTQTQTGIAVAMVVSNSGDVAANVASAANWLIFRSGATDVSSEYTVTVSGGNPTTVPAAGNATFNFTVAVASTATLGAITLDGQASGTDSRTGAATSDSGATTTDSWTVLGNRPPVACFSADVTVIAVNGTVNFDAGCSTDLETPLASLQVEWDWTGDGTFDTAPTTVKTAAHAYALAGTYRSTLRVSDVGGAQGYHSVVVVVANPATTYVVTTTNDDNGTCDASCSLREAITAANARAGLDTITFSPTVFSPAAPGTITLGSILPALTDSAGVQIVGNRNAAGAWGVVVSRNDDLFVLQSASNTIAHLEITGATGNGEICINSTAAMTFNWLYENYVHACNIVMIINGGTNEIGPGNVFRPQNENTGLNLAAGNNQNIHDNRLYGCNQNCITMAAATSGHTIWKNFFYASSGRGIFVDGSNVNIWHNTFDGLATGGAEAIDVTGTNHEVMNNIFSNNTSGAICYHSGLSPTTLDYNVLFNNAAAGATCAALPAGSNSQPAPNNLDPLYVNRGAADFSLLATSPYIDAGFDVGVDTNGVGPGLYYGSAPDIGAFESNF